MSAFTRRSFGALSAAGVLGLALTACGGSGDGAATDTGAGASDAGGAEAGTVEVEDNNGTQTVQVPPSSVVATDNRTFETLEDWGVTLTAAARTLMPSTNPLKEDESIIDLGNHREPDLEAVVAAEPTLIINGQRFADYHDDFVKYAPDATILELDPREDQPFADELKRQVSVLGEIFEKQTEAETLGTDLDAAMERVKAAYDGSSTVMAVNTSGGEIGYIAPGQGRALGWTFEALGLVPALEVEGASDDHEGDDISVEAIADSNPAWILVMDRDAAVSADDPEYTPANELLDSSEALAGVTAVAEGNIVYMPADTYTNEGIQTYTEFFNTFADALEGKA
ncbi:siderophore ABC transporter substrate-binding protein [Brachybacterium paraconglomeratum]|uniref:siderophore ABC transporter substrate-binding protein n=1 Tax=Brachybacterium paraconglomeratum TaxID=173362 RepID=UPI0037CA5B86